MKKGPKVKIGMTTKERDKRRLTDEVMICPKCKEKRPIGQFSTKKYKSAEKGDLHYLSNECNKCQYKRKMKKHGHNTQKYNKTQLLKETTTLKGRVSKLYYNSKARSKNSKNRINFTINRDYLMELARPMKCKVTNVPLILDIGSPYSMSIDRINNNKGYVEGNVQIVAQMYNFCKNNFTDEEVIEFLKNIEV